MMKKEEYVSLYEKCAAGKGTEQERKLLEEYQDAFTLEDLPWNEARLGDQRQVEERVYRLLQARMHTPAKPAREVPYRFLAAAAAIAAVIFCAAFYYLSTSFRPPALAGQPAGKHNIAPGGKKAVLTLADGKQIVLDNSHNGVLARQRDAIIRKAREGQLVYNLSNNPSTRSAAAPELPAPVYNSISTPRGGEYQLVLPDGTKVWLNAASTLRFPVVFNGQDRQVELSGEAYFEVAKNKVKPFRVLAGVTEVEVLGTHFNVEAYSQSSGVKTTLLEGAVRLKKDGRQVLLKPGQCGIPAATGTFSVQQADVEAAVAWKNGYFVFQDEHIYNIMEKVARWYDVEVVYRGNMSGKNFWGKVSRQESIHELLKNLELTGSIHFTIEDRPGQAERRIIVMP